MDKKKGKYKTYRKGVFCVLYAVSGRKTEYLLFHRILHWKGWEFLKGGRRKDEEEVDAIKREIKEETGLKPLKIKKFRTSGRFEYDPRTKSVRKKRGQTYVLFSAQVEKKRVKISKEEHDRYKWCSYKQALELLTWPDQKECLELVHKALK